MPLKLSKRDDVHIAVPVCATYAVSSATESPLRIVYSCDDCDDSQNLNLKKDKCYKLKNNKYNTQTSNVNCPLPNAQRTNETVFSDVNFLSMIYADNI